MNNTKQNIQNLNLKLKKYQETHKNEIYNEIEKVEIDSNWYDNIPKNKDIFDRDEEYNEHAAFLWICIKLCLMLCCIVFSIKSLLYILTIVLKIC